MCVCVRSPSAKSEREQSPQALESSGFPNGLYSLSFRLAFLFTSQVHWCTRFMGGRYFLQQPGSAAFIGQFKILKIIKQVFI